MQIQLETDPDGAIAAEIGGRFLEALRQNAPPNGIESLILIARYGTDIVGALIGPTSYGWLMAKILWGSRPQAPSWVPSDLAPTGKASSFSIAITRRAMRLA